MKFRIPSYKSPSWFITLFLCLCGFKTADDLFEISKNLEIFNSLYQQIQENYVDDVKPGALMRSGIDGMLGSLDPYTNYFSEAQAENALMDLQGEYSGVGCNFKIEKGFPVITQVYGGFAFAKADIRPGDIMLEANGNGLKNKTYEQIGLILRGSANTSLEIKIKRNEQELNKTLKREEIRKKNVPFFGMANEEIGYIKLETFGSSASEEVESAFSELKKSHPVKKLIIDLRFNGGGLLNEAVEIVGLFVPKGTTVVTMKGKNPKYFQEWKTPNSPVDLNIPLVVLINEKSASASEVVSGSLQDLDRAVIIGRNSFGKGLVQQTFPLPFRSQAKITIAKYYTPSGRCIQLLDYSKRNPDGTVLKTPDSLRKVFKTVSGRKVLDGGGVKPDVAVNEYANAPIIKKLSQKNWIFEYANEYRNSHEKIVSAKEFKLSESEWNEILNTSAEKLAEESYEEMSKQLEKTFEDEDLAYQIMRESTNMEKLKLLWKNKMMEYEKPLKYYLEQEICIRYYYENALFEMGFISDPDIKKALEVLQLPSTYTKLLAP